jgi:hypothetical protein
MDLPRWPDMRGHRRRSDVGGHRAAAVGRRPGCRCGGQPRPVDHRAGGFFGGVGFRVGLWVVVGQLVGVGYVVDVNFAKHLTFADPIAIGEPDAEQGVADTDTDT